MLSGVDASASVTSQSEPRPVLFRIVDEGILPNGTKSCLKGCFISGAAIGDISSGRGMMRIGRISCVFKNKRAGQGFKNERWKKGSKRNRKNERILDTQVWGYISGSDGKAGMLGIPTFHGENQVALSALSGVMSGVADAISKQYTTVSPLGQMQSIDTKKVMQYGGTQGISSGLNRLSDYYIKRAEQYQPVIQISAGQVINIVFLKGFWLDGKQTDSLSLSDDSSELGVKQENHQNAVPNEVKSVIDQFTTGGNV